MTDARYLAQLKPQCFSQGEKRRIGVFGVRLVETKFANVRLFLQIGDSRDGTIAWEGVEELRISSESVLETNITPTRVIERAARDLIATLPWVKSPGTVSVKKSR